MATCANCLNSPMLLMLLGSKQPTRTGTRECLVVQAAPNQSFDADGYAAAQFQRKTRGIWRMAKAIFHKLWLLPLCSVVFALLFRSLVWASWVPPPDDPYGASDIVELLLVGVTIVLSLICLLAAALLIGRPPRDTRLAGLLGLSAIISLPLHLLLQPLVPTFRLW